MKRTLINTNGIDLFCLDTESGEQSILCLHGRWGRGETWADFMQRYQDRYRIIAPDQRGHGLSDKPDTGYTADDLAADIYELVRHLDIAPVIIVGHSMGGRIAAHIAAQYPDAVRALVILDETAEGDPDVADLPPGQVLTDDGLTSAWPTPYASYIEAVNHLSGLFPLKTNLDYFTQSLTRTEAGYDFQFSRQAMAALKQYNRPWFDLLPQIQCPTLLVRAVDSWCLSAESARKMCPMIKDVTYAEVSNSDHMVYADNPEEFYEIMDRFLDRVGKGAQDN